MGFSGGGSNVTKPHTHSSSIVQDGGALNMDNVTQASLTAGDMIYSNGTALQRVAIGSDTNVLTISGSTPSWVASTSNSLIKVTKSYSDIVVGTTSMPIYTLPQDAALVNIWTDITTVFDISTAVTIGDNSDNDGFAQSTNWTTGLTDATRGAYVTTFKTMRSTSGTTDINAYGFSTTGGANLFEQNLVNSNRGFSAAGPRIELAQQFNAGHVLAGSTIDEVTFQIKGKTAPTPTGTVSCYIREADGTLIATSPDTIDMSTLTTSFVTYTFTFPSTALAATDMITTAYAFTNAGETEQETQTTEMTNGKLYGTTTIGSSYVQIVGEEMTMTVTYDVTPVVSDTQGAVDFYLQVVA